MNTLKAAPAALVLSLLSCSGNIGLDIDAAGQSTVQGDPLGGLITLPASMSGFSNIDVSQKADFTNSNTKKDHIQTCRVSSFSLRVVSPAGQDLSFFSSIAFSIEAPNLPKVRIAHRESFPSGTTSVDLTLDEVDIAAYAKADSFSITTTASAHAPPHDTTIEAKIKLHVEASIL